MQGKTTNDRIIKLKRQLAVLDRYADPKNNASDNERSVAAIAADKIRKELQTLKYDYNDDKSNKPGPRIKVSRVPKGITISIAVKERPVDLMSYSIGRKSYTLLASNQFELESGISMAQKYLGIEFSEEEKELINREVSGLNFWYNKYER